MKKILISLTVLALLGMGTVALAGHSSHDNNGHEQHSSDDTPCINPIPVPGCMDSTATNYNPLATTSDESCTYPPTPILGCTDSTASNYNPAATQDDDSCLFPPPPPVIVPGCMDVNATNYNPAANQDDDSCTYPPVVTPPGGSGDTNPPVDNPPVTPPVDNPPSGGGGSTPPVETPPNPPVINAPTTGGGGGIGFVPPQTSQNSDISTSTSTPLLTQCVPLTNFKVDIGISGDGKVTLTWDGGSNDTKFIVYGTSKNLLNNFITASGNVIELTNLLKVNYWFGVSNACSTTSLIDPIP